MAKVEIDVVKPNLHVHCYDSLFGRVNGIYLGLDDINSFVQSARAVNQVVRETLHADGLKVKESDLEAFKKGHTKWRDSETYTAPLDEYLDIFEERGRIPVLNRQYADLFKLDYIIDSTTLELSELDLGNWKKDRNVLSNPEKAFDGIDEGGPLKLDRTRSLDSIRKRYEELDSKIPDQIAELEVIPASLSQKPFFIGFVGLVELREDGRGKIESAQAKLVDKLKEFDGPCLSYETHTYYQQFWKLFGDAQNIVNSYGDILLNPNWQERFFRYDP